MAPIRSSSAKDMLTVLAEVAAHIPSVVPRTVTETASPPRFASARKFHTCELRTSSHPPDGVFGCPVSIVCIEHFAMTRVSVTPFVKSTSKSLYAVPKGVHWTEIWPMFGGTRMPSVGYTILMGGAELAHGGALFGGNVQPLQSGVVNEPIAPPASANGDGVLP